MAKKTLDDMKAELVDVFNLAVQFGKEDYTFDNNESHQAAAIALLAATQAAQGIIAIEREQREAKLAGPFRLDKP